MPRKKQPQPRLSRRHKRRLAGSAVCAAVLACFALLSTTVLFPITRCAPEGASRYSAEDFAQAMELHAQRLNLFTANTDKLTAKAEKALPYAEITAVKRKLPGTLQLTVRERSAAFAQQQGKVWWLIAANGILLEAAPQQPKGVLTVTGKALQKPAAGTQAKWRGTAVTAKALQELLDSLKQSPLRKHITGLRISSAALPEAVYQDRIRIRFGAGTLAPEEASETSLEDKLRLAEQVIASLDEQNPNQRGNVDFSIAGQAFFSPEWQ
jgi:hypothetical protein